MKINKVECAGGQQYMQCICCKLQSQSEQKIIQFKTYPKA